MSDEEESVGRISSIELEEPYKIVVELIRENKEGLARLAEEKPAEQRREQ